MNKTLREWGAEHVLVSYFYLRQKGTKAIERVLTEFPDVFLDSGAFTLRQQIRREHQFVDSSEENQWVMKYIDDYVEFITRYGDVFTLVAEVDVGTWQQKTRYREILTEKLPSNITLLPVIHRADPDRYVEFLCQKYPYVAYAGLKGYSVAENRRYMARRLIPAVKNGTQVHGFALTAVDIMRAFGLASVDSASWLHGGKHGMTFWFDGQHLRAYDKFQKWVRLRFKNEVKDLGISWIDFLDDKPYAINGFNLAQWLKFQNYLDSEVTGLGKFKKHQEQFWRGEGEEWQNKDKQLETGVF